jgi:hypothetical protein
MLSTEDLLKYGIILIALWIGYCLFLAPKTPDHHKMEAFAGNFQELNGGKQKEGHPKETHTSNNKCPGNYVASSLLPKGDPKMKDWADLAPKGPLEGVDLLLEPNKTIGYDTVGNHLRNASYDLRKEPPCPVQQVSPWLNTTMGPDLNRKPLEDCSGWTVAQK